MEKLNFKNRIIASGTFSDHCHALVGNGTYDEKTQIITVNESPDYPVFLKEMQKIMRGKKPVEKKREQYRKLLAKNYNVTAVMHLKESAFLAGQHVWTEEHMATPLPVGTHEYVPQEEKNPYTETIERTKD